MRAHITKKKVVLIVCTVLIILAAAAAAGYFGYGATLLNPNSDESIKSIVSKKRYGTKDGLGDQEIEIICKEQYGDYFAVLFQTLPQGNAEKGGTYFSVYKKHNYYKNRYIFESSTRDANGYEGPLYCQIPATNSAHMLCFFADTSGNAPICSVIEMDPENAEYPYYRKVEELEVPQNEPYIFVKEYDLAKSGNSIVCLEGSVEDIPGMRNS